MLIDPLCVLASDRSNCCSFFRQDRRGEGTLRETTSEQLAKVQFLPFRHRFVWPSGTTRGNRKDGFHRIYRKGSGQSNGALLTIWYYKDQYPREIGSYIITVDVSNQTKHWHRLSKNKSNCLKIVAAVEIPSETLYIWYEKPADYHLKIIVCKTIKTNVAVIVCFVNESCVGLWSPC